MKKLYVTDLGLKPKIASIIMRVGKIKTDNEGYITQESYESYQEFLKEHYFLHERLNHLAEEVGITLSTLNNKVSKGELSPYLMNLGTEERGNALYVFKREDESKIIDKLVNRGMGSARYKESFLSIEEKSAHPAISGMDRYIASRLIMARKLKLNKSGEIDKESLKEHEKFMQNRYYLRERASFIVQQADITLNTFNIKVYVNRQIEQFLSNIGLDFMGNRVYVYNKEDEAKIIEVLKKKPKRRPGLDSKRTFLRTKDISIDPHLIKFSEAASECSLEERLLGEVMGRLKLESKVIEVAGLQITVLDRDDYQKVKKYVWEIRRPKF